MEANLYKGKNTSPLNFPRGTISEVSFEGLKITSIDQVIHPDSLSLLKSVEENCKHFIFVGSGIDNVQIAELIKDTSIEGIILHSGIGKNKKAELLNLLDESLWDKVYSLRENGSLEFSL